MQKNDAPVKQVAPAVTRKCHNRTAKRLTANNDPLCNVHYLLRQQVYWNDIRSIVSVKPCLINAWHPVHSICKTLPIKRMHNFPPHPTYVPTLPENIFTPKSHCFLQTYVCGLEKESVLTSLVGLLLLLWRAHQALPIWGDKEVLKRWGIPPDSESGGIRLSLMVIDISGKSQ